MTSNKQEAPAPLLEVVELTKAFRGLAAVRGMDLCVQPGEIVGLIGHNGAGKSTTLKAIMGEVRPDSGTLRIVGSEAPEARRRVGYVAQDQGLYPDLTGRENLDFLARARAVASEDRPRAVEEALEWADLGEAADRLFREYSGGMGRRLSLAGAFLGGTVLVILDEAFQGLDPEATLRFRDRLLSHAKDGGGAVVCSHSLDLLARLATRVGFMSEGRLVREVPGGDVEALEACFK